MILRDLLVSKNWYEAQDIDGLARRINAVVRSHRSITADTALRLTQ